MSLRRLDEGRGDAFLNRGSYVPFVLEGTVVHQLAELASAMARSRSTHTNLRTCSLRKYF